MPNPNPPCPAPRFQAAIRKYGVPDEEIFQTADLFERRNIAQVTLCIFALARIVSSKVSFPFFCPICLHPPRYDAT